MKMIHSINGKEEIIYDNIVNLNKENNKKYHFFLDNISNYIYITDRLVFERENDEYIIHIEIGENNTCNIYLKDKELSFNIKVINAKYIERNNAIEYEYTLETDNDKHNIVLEIEE